MAGAVTATLVVIVAAYRFRSSRQDRSLPARPALPGNVNQQLSGYTFTRSEGGRRIFLLTDRRINYWEAASGSRTLDYPFTLIELQLDRNDTGMGKLNIAAKITGSEDSVIEIEDFAAQPVRLNNVHKVKS